MSAHYSSPGGAGTTEVLSLDLLGLYLYAVVWTLLHLLPKCRLEIIAGLN